MKETYLLQKHNDIQVVINSGAIITLIYVLPFSEIMRITGTDVMINFMSLTC